MRRVNFLFLAGLLIVALAAAGSVYLFHRHQMRRNAAVLLQVAHEAESAGNLNKAASILTQYLGINRNDDPIYAWHARLVDRVTPSYARTERILDIFEEALRRNLGDRTVERRCAEIAMDPRVRRYQDAIRHLDNLFDAAQSDRQLGAEAAELLDLRGQCQEATSQFDKALASYTDSIKKDPSRVVTFDRWARLLREAKKDSVQADQTIEEMVKKNPGSALALVTRHRYRKAFGLAAEEADIARALQLSPDDAEVLIAAAELARQKNDLAGARKPIERGLERHPDRVEFYQLSSALELAESHLDRAEAVLRRGIESVTDNGGLKYLLTDILLDEAMQGDESKLKGDDGARAWIERLRAIGLPDGHLNLFEARAAIAGQSWKTAIPLLESARSLLSGDASSLSRVNLLLAECYDREGRAEDRMAAIERAASGGTLSDPTSRLLYAQELARQGKFDHAIVIHRELAPSRPESHFDAVRLLIQKNSRLPQTEQNWGLAERWLADAEKANPTAKEEIILLRADLLTAQNHLDEARRILATAQADYPRSLPLRLARALTARRGNKHPEASQILDDAEKDLGPSLGIQLARLDLVVGQGEDDAQTTLLRIASASNALRSEDRPQLYEKLAQVATLLRQPALAQQYWDQTLALQPSNLNALLSLLDLSLQNQDLSRARGLVDSMSQYKGDDGQFYGRFCQAALEIEEYRRNPRAASQNLEQAGDLALQITQLRPDWWGGPLLKGQIAELNGLPDEAIEHYQRAIQLGDLNPAHVSRLLAILFLQPGDHSARIEKTSNLLAKAGVSGQALTVIRAMEEIRKGDIDEGIRLARSSQSRTSTGYSDHLMMARILMDVGRSAEAGKELERAVELGPGVPDTWVSYVRYLVSQTKQFERAREVIKSAARSLPPDRSALTLASCWEMVGDTTQAAALIQKARQEKPDDPATGQRLVRLYLAQGRLTEALQELERFEKRTAAGPEDLKVWARTMRPVLLLKIGRPADQDQALKAAEENLRNNPGSLEDRRLVIGILAMLPGRRTDAIKQLEELGRTGRLNISDLLLLADLYLKSNQEARYQETILKIVGPGKANPPRGLVSHINYLISRNRIGEIEPFLGLLKKADRLGLATLELEARWLELLKRKADVLSLLEDRAREVPDQLGLVGELLARFGYNTQAEHALKAFQAQDPANPQRALPLAHFYESQGQIARAMPILNQVLESSKRPELAASAALALYGSPSADVSQKHQIRALIKAADNRQPGTLGLKIVLAEMSVQDEDYDKAVACFRQVLTLDPDHVLVLNHLAWILALRDPPDTEQALKCIDHAIQVEGSDPSLSDTRAVILIRSGRLDQAQIEIKAAREMPAQSPSLSRALAIHLAWAYHANGQLAEARRAFQEALAGGYKLESAGPLERRFVLKVSQDVSSGAESPGTGSS